MNILLKLFQSRIFFRYCFWKAVISYFGGSIGRGTAFYEGTKIYTTKKSRVEIGESCTFQQGSILSAADARISLGRHVYLGEYVVVSAKESIEIGDNAILATHTFVVDFDHDFEDAKQSLYNRFKTKKVKIGADAWIGAGCKILKGVSIGEGSVVGAGSVVTHDTPPFSVSVGVPARVIRYREHSPIKQ